MTEDEKDLTAQLQALALSRAKLAFLVGQLLGQVTQLQFILEADDPTTLSIALAMTKGILSDAQPLVQAEFYRTQPEPPDILK